MSKIFIFLIAWILTFSTFISIPQIIPIDTFQIIESQKSIADKWYGVMKRNAINGQSYDLHKALTPEQLQSINLDLNNEMQLLTYTNDLVNSVPYVSDRENYDKIDYWVTPKEFFKNGGDCEDEALAKYIILRDSGVDARTMKLLVVYVKEDGKYHAILDVNYNGTHIYMDNGGSPLRYSIPDYDVIYSINDYGIEAF